MKESRYAAEYILCEYTLQTDDQTLDAVESVQTVRAVWTGQQWELHFACQMRIETPDTPGENTAGIDLGICNTAAVSVGDETLLYPGNALKEDAHYFRQEEYETEGENGPSQKAQWARQTKSRRQDTYCTPSRKTLSSSVLPEMVGQSQPATRRTVVRMETGDDTGTNACMTGRSRRF